jgi:hypothetical protein
MTHFTNSHMRLPLRFASLEPLRFFLRIFSPLSHFFSPSSFQFASSTKDHNQGCLWGAALFPLPEFGFYSDFINSVHQSWKQLAEPWG